MKAKQARAPEPKPFGAEAFGAAEKTVVRWLGNAGALVTSRGTAVMIDPVLTGFDMPQLVPPPIQPEAVPALDAVLITHADGDHFSRETCAALSKSCGAFHGTRYVGELLAEMGLPGAGHAIGARFTVGQIGVTLTPADHAWQADYPEIGGYVFGREDCCGFWLDTPDGAVWAVGDSRLLPEHLTMAPPKLILFDFSDDSWHIGLNNAVRLANAYPQAKLLLWHWGCTDAPDMKPFNADPADPLARIQNPARALVLAPGEAYVL